VRQHTPALSFADSSLERFRSDARSWIAGAARSFGSYGSDDEAHEIDVRRAWEREVYQAGYSCLSWPTRFGGQGLGALEEFIFAEECADAGVPESLGRVGRLLAAPALFKHGTAAQQQRFLPAIVEGREIWCQGFSEPGAGSDLASLRATATRVGDSYRMNGQKLWISFALYSDWCLLLARTAEPASRHRGLTMFALPMKQTGVRVRGIRQINGRSEFAEIFLEDAEVSIDDRIGAEGEGWSVAMTILAAERGSVFGAIAVKRIGNDLEMLSGHCARGDANGVASLAVRLELLRWQIMRSIEQATAGLDPIRSAAILKVTWSELAQDVVRAGFATSCADHVDRWRDRLLDARETTIASGTSEIQRNVIAERVLGLPR
jgi:alkylation response protein AidB-like acyl-CoA dehydrogenase